MKVTLIKRNFNFWCNFRPFCWCNQGIGRSGSGWFRPHKNPTEKRSKNADHRPRPILRIWLEENRPRLQKGKRTITVLHAEYLEDDELMLFCGTIGICLQRDSGRASRIRRSFAASRRSARKYLPVAYQNPTCKSWSIKSSRILKKHTRWTSNQSSCISFLC